ncbi:MAG: hypothetical protein ACK4YF_06685 [Exilispira sp.]
MENFNSKTFPDNLNQKLQKIFPINEIHLISIKINSHKSIIITIMKKGGVSIDDCKLVSSIISSYIPDDYDLQVQSPGIGFEIKKDNFNLLNLFIGLPVKVFYKAFNSENIVKNNIYNNIDKNSDNDLNFNQDNFKAYTVLESEGTLTFVDRVVSIKKFSNNNKKNISKSVKNRESKSSNDILNIKEEDIITISLDRIIKIKTTFYPEEL